MSRRPTATFPNRGLPDMALVPQISPRAVETRAPHVPGRDVVGIQPGPAALAPALRAAAGFRVDGPDGRVGVLNGVTPAEPAAPPERLLISIGLFIVTVVAVPVAEVRSVDAERRRIVLRTTPQLPHRTPAQLARGVRRFVRTAARRAGRDETTGTFGRQR